MIALEAPLKTILGNVPWQLLLKSNNTHLKYSSSAKASSNSLKHKKSISMHMKQWRLVSKEAWDEHHAKQKQNDIDELIAIMRAKGIDLADLQGLKQPKKKAETTPSEKINIRYVNRSG